MSEPCLGDTNCINEVCSALLQCAPESTLRTVTLSWTVRGEAATESSCGGVSASTIELSLADVVSPWYHDLRVLAPVPCSSGRMVIERVPPAVTHFGSRIDDELEKAWFDGEGVSVAFDIWQIRSPI